MTAIKSAVQLCNMECIMLHYKDAHIDNQLSQKLLKIMDEMAESIRREVKSTFEIESKGEGSGMRNLFSGEIQTIFNQQISHIKESNQLTQNLSMA